MQNKIDLYIKALIIAFFIIILLPISNIDNSKYSPTENRRLANYKSFYDTKTGKINTNYGKDFENWFKDRFFGRKQLIQLNALIKYHFSGRFLLSKKIIIDKKNNYFYKQTSNIVYKTKEQEKISEQLSSFNEYCKRHNIKLYVVILPLKEIIYPPEIYPRNNNNTYIKKVVSNINKNNAINLIFPIDDYLKSKEETNNLIFFKSDTHMTSDGAFIGYNELINLIKKDFSQINKIKKEDCNYYYDKTIRSGLHLEYKQGNLWYSSGLPNIVAKHLINTKYKYYIHKDFANLKIKPISKDKYKERLYSYSKGSNLKVMLIGDSFTDILMDIFPYSFKQTYRIRLNIDMNTNDVPSYEEQYKIIKYYDKTINKFHPDIIILYLNYDKSSLGRLTNLTVLE